MTCAIWITYAGTVLILMSTPGPSHLLMLSNSLSNGFTRTLATAAGDLSANVAQMLIAGIGLAGLIRATGDFFLVVKWLGVSYLVVMGILQFRRRLDPSIAVVPQRRSLRSLYLQGFLTSAANPKAVFFFAALFPLFIDPAAPAAEQLLVLGLTYLFIDGCFLSIYGGFASWIANRFRHHVGRHMNRISGALLVLAAVLLGLKDMQTG